MAGAAEGQVEHPVADGELVVAVPGPTDGDPSASAGLVEEYRVQPLRGGHERPGRDWPRSTAASSAGVRVSTAMSRREPLGEAGVHRSPKPSARAWAGRTTACPLCRYVVTDVAPRSVSSTLQVGHRQPVAAAHVDPAEQHHG